MTKTTVVISYIILVAISVYLAHRDWGKMAARVREGPRGWLARLRRLITTPAGFAMGLFIVLVVIGWLYPEHWPIGKSIKNFYGQFWTEALGIVITVVIIEQLYQVRQREQERQLNIQRWREEIEDYLGWDEKEATYRIVGNIRRLNREGVTTIWLHEAFLQKAHLDRADLSGAKLHFADLSGAILFEADLHGANLNEADLSRANLCGAKMSGGGPFKTDLRLANLNGAIYNAEPFEDRFGITHPPTQWPEGFDPVAAGAIDVSKEGE